MTSLIAFFTLTYAVSWICFFGAARAMGGSLAPSTTGIGAAALFYIGVFAPALVGLAIAAWTSGRSGAAALVRRIGQWPAQARWFVFAAGYMFTIKLAAAVIHRVGAGAWPPFGQEPLYIMVLGTIVSTPVQAGEELGWRAFALPRLAASLGLGPASILLGVIWACWHLPLFYLPGGDTFQQSFTVYLASVTAMSIAMAWLYWRTNGSLLLTMLLHAAANNTKDIVPSAVSSGSRPFIVGASPIAIITAVLLWICAVYFLVRMQGARVDAGSTVPV